MAGTMLLTGGNGFLGRRVHRLAAAAGWHVVVPTSRELDVRDADALATIIAGTSPAAVVHLAYRRTERDTIVDGSRAVALAAVAGGARLVHLSTDVVFGGRDLPYDERTVPHPVEDYGEAKAAAEVDVAAADPTAALVRTSLLLGDGDDLGRPEVDVIAAAQGERPFTFFRDEVRCPARAEDVAAAVVALVGPLRDLSGLLHVAGPEPLDRFTLASRIARARGLDPGRLSSSTTEEAGLTGRRPGRVVLDVGLADSYGLTCRPV